ncbi:ATP-dependent zinc protease [Lysobacter rhizosphaerae]|jgi:hypothetical protein
MARHIPRERIMLGWREWASLPRLGLPAVRCKIDSGARSSALHVDRYWRFSERGGPWVGFRLSNDGHGEATVQAAAPVFDERDVIDSGGHRTRRIFLRTTLALAGVEREIEINLTDRQGMLFPMLLGRTAMAGWFAVDPARSFLHGRREVGTPAIARPVSQSRVSAIHSPIRASHSRLP